MTKQLTLQEVKAFQHKILSWYQDNKRDLPWRKTHDPYKILVSEVMSQQTQINRIVPKYELWIKRFSTVEVLAQAATAEILTLWSGLGYNRRALYLQKTAREIVDKYHGQFPQDIHMLKALPGIGEYTASALLCFAFGREIVVVDTNVRKVILTQFLGRKSASENEITEIATSLIPQGKAREWNQALMDFSAIMLKKEKIVVPEQSTFLRSRRYYRGQILKLLVEKKKITSPELNELFRTSPYTRNEIISGLIKDGLITEEDNTLIFVA